MSGQDFREGYFPVLTLFILLLTDKLSMNPWEVPRTQFESLFKKLRVLPKQTVQAKLLEIL